MTAPDEPLGLYLNPADIRRDGYPLAWNAIKNQVREEAGHRCVRCGHPYQVGRWRILTVHHLNGVKADCRWWNLVALCQRCHLSVQGRVRMAQVWPWEHTEWFQPYVAGFYAWEHLGQDLTRSEVEARLVELLDLERTA